MDLSGFSAFDFSEGVPYFSVTLNGLTFNKAVVLKLGSPAYVRLLINEESRQVVLQVCEETTPKATTFYKPKKNGVLSVRWSSQDLVATFKRLLENDFQEHGYRVDGESVRHVLSLKKLEQKLKTNPLTRLVYPIAPAFSSISRIRRQLVCRVFERCLKGGVSP